MSNIPKYDAAFNRMRWMTCKIAPSRLTTVTSQAKWIVANRKRYEAVQAATGVPWWFIGCLHVREAGAGGKAFQGYLANGDPINRVSVHVPKGRGPFATWELGAIDALRIQKFDKVTDWSVEHALYLAEEYNGWGYAWKGLPSPYVWGATSLQKPGKYVADGVFDSSVMDTQIGVAALLQVIMSLVGGLVPGLIENVVKSSTSTAGTTISPQTTNSSIISIAIGALMAGIGASGFGADVIHTITTFAGVAVTVLSAINHTGLISASNANTEALVEQLLAQIAAYNPPIPQPSTDITGVPTGGVSDVAKVV